MNTLNNADRNDVLAFLAHKPMLTIQEAVILISEYIFDIKAVRVVITDISNTELFEKAATIATNYYILKHESTLQKV